MSTVVNKIGGIIRNAFDPRKMEEWQKENAKKMEEFRKAIEAEFKKTKEDSKK